MSDEAGVEQEVKIDIKTPKETEKPQGDFVMRYADAGDPTSIIIETKKGTYVRNEKTGMGTYKGVETSINPHFSEILPIGSILNIGESQTFQIVEPSKSANQEKFKDSVFAKRIPLENTTDDKGSVIKGFNTLAQELEAQGKSEMIFNVNKGNIPYTRETSNRFVQTDTKNL